jgi:hypothetical protein
MAIPTSGHALAATVCNAFSPPEKRVFDDATGRSCLRVGLRPHSDAV